VASSVVSNRREAEEIVKQTTGMTAFLVLVPAAVLVMVVAVVLRKKTNPIAEPAMAGASADQQATEPPVTACIVTVASVQDAAAVE